jgi:RNA polymerase sigma-70 factor (ECF subfamily)
MLHSNYSDFFSNLRKGVVENTSRRVFSEEGMSSFPRGAQLVGIIRQQRTAAGLQDPTLQDATLQDQVSRLFEEARDDVYRYLLTLGLHPPRAQEAAQEVFLRLYATLRKGEEIQNPRAWIFRVAHNLGLKIRARQNSEEPYDSEIGGRFTTQGFGTRRFDTQQETPESELIDRERMTRFHNAVEGLSEQQRRCLFLRLEGLRYPEIGSALGISASAVGEFLRRAMVRLKKVRYE